jgi:hypothetical protein
MTSPSRRKDLDVMKLFALASELAQEANASFSRMMNDYEVNVGEATGEYFITFYGPKDSTYSCCSMGDACSLMFLFALLSNCAYLAQVPTRVENGE